MKTYSDYLYYRTKAGDKYDWWYACYKVKREDEDDFLSNRGEFCEATLITEEEAIEEVSEHFLILFNGRN
jgi:hypothetical protein